MKIKALHVFAALAVVSCGIAGTTETENHNLQIFWGYGKDRT